MKNLLYIFILLIAITSCKQNPKVYLSELHFETMGTFGTVKIVADSLISEETLSKQIDSILFEVNNSFSTYIESSTISRFNRQDTGFVKTGSEFTNLFARAVVYAYETNGAFNSQILPLVLYYGFAYEPGHVDIDTVYIEGLVSKLNKPLEHEVTISLNEYDLIKKSNVQLDFSAFAKGYGVDVVAYYLDSLDIENYMVEIGGEVHCKGKNQAEDYWRLGIEEPNEDARAIYEVVALNNKSMATSGNYRNFKILENGQKIVHIINPKTGYPEVSNLLSASIIADNCMDADAYATACMVMGVDTCFQFVLNHPELECYLIYSDENGQLQKKYSEGFKKMIVN